MIESDGCVCRLLRDASSWSNS